MSVIAPLSLHFAYLFRLSLPLQLQGGSRPRPFVSRRKLAAQAVARPRRGRKGDGVTDPSRFAAPQLVATRPPPAALFHGPQFRPVRGLFAGPAEDILIAPSRRRSFPASIPVQDPARSQRRFVVPGRTSYRLSLTATAGHPVGAGALARPVRPGAERQLPRAIAPLAAAIAPRRGRKAAAGAAVSTPPVPPRATAFVPREPLLRQRPVVLVWRSPGEATDTAGRSISNASAPVAAAAIAVPRPAAAPPAPAALAATQVDRLVDEVLRRLDRVSRSERLRRGV